MITSTDRKIIELMAEGLTNKQMADQLYKSKEKIVGKQRSRLFKKIGVKNAPHCIAWAYKNKVLIVNS